VIILLLFTIKPFFQKSDGLNNEKKGIDDAINQVFNLVAVESGSTEKVFSIGSGRDEEKVIVSDTPEPNVMPTPFVVYETVTVDRYVPIMPNNELRVFRYSYYYPPLGGVNCRLFENGYCVSSMASGDPWENYLGLAVACDSEFPLGTRFLVVAPEEIKGEYVCLDRGGGIEGTDLLDFLSESQKLPWLEKVYAYILN